MEIRAFPIFRNMAVGGSIFVLLVDDDAAFADAAARSLEAVGMRTILALGSMDALNAFDGNTIDVFVTDVGPPAGEAQALALAQMIRNKGVRMPIILITAYPELLEGKVALPGSARCNPFELAELCREIKVRMAL